MNSVEYQKVQAHLLNILGSQKLSIVELECQLGFCGCPACPNKVNKLEGFLMFDVRSTMLPLLVCGELVYDSQGKIYKK